MSGIRERAGTLVGVLVVVGQAAPACAAADRRVGEATSFDTLPGVEVWRADYEDGFAGWRDLHECSAKKPPYTESGYRDGSRTRANFSGEDRLRIVTAPVRQGKHAARLVVYAGDKPICASGERVQHLRAGINESEGDESWYSWSSMLAEDFPHITGTWQIITQWHGPGGGNQPPVYVFLDGDTIGFKTVEHDDAGKPFPSVVHWTAPMARGRWHDFVAHIRWSFHRSVGFVELYHRLEGERTHALVVPRTFRRTLVYRGKGNYFVPGYYRGSNAGPPGVVYHDGWVQTKATPHGFPRTFHIWGGSDSALGRFDLVVGYPEWNIAARRVENPTGVFLIAPRLDPFTGSTRGVAVTYGQEDTFKGAVDDVADGIAAALGEIPAWDVHWDTLHRPDGSVAPVNPRWKHPGWNLADPTGKGTPEKVAKIMAYAAKLSKVYRNGWDGIWSDNWIYRIGASWFYGPDLDTDRDGKVDDMRVVGRQWWDGLDLVGRRLREYLPGKIVGGNGSWNVTGLFTGTDPEGPYKTTNVTLNEVLRFYTDAPKAEEFVLAVQKYVDYPDPYGQPRYFAAMHRLAGRSDYRAMRWGLTLCLVAGAYYEAYGGSHGDQWLYDEYDGGEGVRRRRYLGQPLGPARKLAAGVWRRDFENGVALNNSTNADRTVPLEATYRKIRGTQDAGLNDGSLVRSVTIPAKDGIVLLRENLGDQSR